MTGAPEEGSRSSSSSSEMNEVEDKLRERCFTRGSQKLRFLLQYHHVLIESI